MQKFYLDIEKFYEYSKYETRKVLRFQHYSNSNLKFLIYY